MKLVLRNIYQNNQYFLSIWNIPCVKFFFFKVLWKPYSVVWFKNIVLLFWCKSINTIKTLYIKYIKLFLFVFKDYLCSPEANIYGIDFTRFKLRDMDSGAVLFEVAKPPPPGLFLLFMMKFMMLVFQVLNYL